MFESIDNVEKLLAKVVSYNTVTAPISGNPKAERDLSLFYKNFAESLKFKTEFLAVPGLCDNLLISYEVSKDLPWILFESHMDTVTVDGMTVDPFNVTIKENKMYGRGTCDTKGSGAAMFWGLKEYANSKEEKPFNIAILYCVNEESGMKGAIAFSQIMPKLSFRPTAVIVGEPTMLQPVIAHNGCARIKIITSGVAVHSSNPQLGHSAIADMSRLVLSFEADYLPTLNNIHPLTGAPQCSINVIKGGTQPNVIADYCEVAMDRRITPDEDPEKVIEDLDSIVSKLNSNYEKMEAELKVLYLNPPFCVDEKNPILLKVQKIITKYGISNVGQGVAYCTEAGHFIKHCPNTIVLGPGDIAQAHTKDEWLELEQLHLAVKVYKEIMTTRN